VSSSIGIRLVAGLVQVALLEAVGVYDEDPALGQVVDVGPQRRRVHGDEDVGVIARREDVPVGDVHLE
jgi:hypothetical protein